MHNNKQNSNEGTLFRSVRGNTEEPRMGNVRPKVDELPMERTLQRSVPSTKQMRQGGDASMSAPISNYPVRKNIRAEFHDYCGGEYFVTICTRDKEHYFGHIKDNRMIMTPIGRYANDSLENLETHFHYVSVRQFVVMPNHIHAIISIKGDEAAQKSMPQTRTPLGVVVGGFKQEVTMYARRNNIEFAWQTRYHDHIIRNSKDGNKIAEYIENNVSRWDADCYNGKNE